MEMEPINVAIVHNPGEPGQIVVGEVDITTSVEAFGVEMVDGVMHAVFHLRPHATINFPCHVTRVAAMDARDLLEGIDAEMVDEWAGSGGMSSTIGQKVMRHLRDWVEARQ